MSFSLGFGPIPWLLMGELLPSRARGPCAAFATGSPRQVFFVRATFSLEWSPASTILDQRLTMFFSKLLVRPKKVVNRIMQSHVKMYGMIIIIKMIFFSFDYDFALKKS